MILSREIKEGDDMNGYFTPEALKIMQVCRYALIYLGLILALFILGSFEENEMWARLLKGGWCIGAWLWIGIRGA